ncbi:hypothetical protein NBRC10512_008049 [Rhodotorula toruloides]|uniref:RHTO0S05e06678g1_1 n=2 Tax=Rhodotorula toruloides TaxID=5286 RepID=A0A061AT12_RHOTO|nr:uncharacterized protein RHTO_06915 [Rhodotorula toruloides NP11]EMS23856.1 hypothetical protein RHTO_06915 [Rhodotorula toruloides NP11]CDR40727.1 RHTO0S05e06678g1_1 [Rhodotorula toruloides]
MSTHSHLAPSNSSAPIETLSDFQRNLANSRSFSQNPRSRRHASLDLGVAQIRARTDSEAPDSPLSSGRLSSAGFDEKQRLLYDSQLSPLYSPFSFPRRPPWWKKRKNLTGAAFAALTLFLLGGIMGLSRLDDPRAKHWWGVKDVLQDYGLELSHPSVCENPYAEFGRISSDSSTPEGNRWLPYDASCVPPPLLATLRSTLKKKPTVEDSLETLEFPLPKRRTKAKRKSLSWLQGKTVLLFGDHVERNHNKDFCRFAGGKWASIDRDHPLSPPPFVNGIDEKLPGAQQNSSSATRPSVCYLEEYDFMVVSVFHFGLANRVEFEHESLLYNPHFYPPVAVDDRLTHIVLPLLDSLNRTKPDMIEFSSGFWDLRHFAALDELAGKDVFSELTTERLAWYSSRLVHALADLSSVFPDTPLLWRTLHHTPKFNETSPARVAALDQLSRKVVTALNEARNRAGAEERLDLLVQHRYEEAQAALLVERSEAGRRVRPTGRRKKTFKDRMSNKAPFLNRVKERIGSKDRIKDVNLSTDETSLRGLLRFDEWGALMRGQEHTMVHEGNAVYTPPLPGGYVWGDLMLFELRRAVLSHRRRLPFP